MKYVLNKNEMKALDYITIQDIGIPSMVLMEKAALSVCNEIIMRVKKTDKVLVVAGVGNNGGDGIAIARILTQKGYHVQVSIIGNEEKATEETKKQLQIARNLGVAFDNIINISEYNIVVDAIFGIGLSKQVIGEHADAIRRINDANNMIFAVDIPSGIDSDTGKIQHVAIKADYTITFGYAKVGLILYPGCEYAGEVIVADIGFADEEISRINPKTLIYQTDDIGRLLPIRKAYSNKGSFGKVLVIAGSKNMSGACFLSAKASYTTGAGLVKVMTVEDNRNIIQTLLPEALLTTYEPDELLTYDIECNSKWTQIIDAINWASVIVMGPGIGMSDSSKVMVDYVVKTSKVPTILDADALNILATMKDYVKKIQVDDMEQYEIDLAKNFIITPHMKEMSRLLHTKMDNMKDIYLDFITSNKMNQKYTLVLKDARTIVVDKENVYINMSGNNGMATGGSGDVLTGIIAGLLAGGAEIFDASSLGVYIHGLAADVAVLEKGTYSLMASDIIDHLSKVMLNM
jgi:NAD(P)H-hydrate epimerase